MKKLVIGFIVVVLVPIIGFVSFLLLSRQGLVFGLYVADRILPGQFSVESVQGRLINSLTLEGVRYSDQSRQITLDHIFLSWHPASLLLRKLDFQVLSLRGLKVHTADEKDAATAESEPKLPPFTLPIALSVQKGALDSLIISSAENTDTTRVQEIIVDDFYGKGELFRFEKVGFATDTMHISAQGEITTGLPYAARLGVSYMLNLEGYSPISGQAELEGSPAKLEFETHLAAPFVGKAQGIARELTGEPKWEGTVTAESVNLTTINRVWPEILLTDPVISGKGTGASYFLDVTTDTAYESAPNLEITATLKGDGEGMRLSGVEIRSDDGKITGEGSLSWKDEFSWAGHFSADSLDLAQVNREWPQILLTDALISGNGADSAYFLEVKARVGYESVPNLFVTGVLKGDAESMQLPDVEIDSQAGKITGEGKLSWQEGFSWSGNFSSDSLTLNQVKKEWPDIVFKGMSVSGRGEGGSYALKIDTGAQYQSFNDIKLAGKLQGDAAGLNITAAEIQYNETELAGKGTLGWQDIFSWQADISGSKINPAILDERFPGSLNLQFTSSGRLQDNKAEAVVNLENLAGELRGFAVTAEGDIEVDGGDIIVDRFHARSGDSSLDVSGRFAEKVALDFALHSPDMETLWPGFSGSLQAVGEVTGTREVPRFRFTVAASEIAAGNVDLDELNGTGQGSLTPQGDIQAVLRAADVAIGAIELDNGILKLQGTLENHQLDLQVDSPSVSGEIFVSGGYTEQKWQGRITRGVLRSEEWTDWHLQEPALLSFSPGLLSVSGLCLTGGDSAHLCAEASYEQGESWQVSADINSLPVDLFSNLHPGFQEMEGTLSGILQAVGDEAGISEARADLTGDNLAMQHDFQEDPEQAVAWEKNTIVISYREGKAEVDAESILKDGSAFRMQAELDSIGLLPFSIEETEISGNMVFTDVGLQLLAAFIPPVVEPSGTLAGKMVVSGRLMEPDLSGNISLREGKIFIPTSGVTVRDVQLQIQGRGEGLKLAVTAKSGEGAIQAQGHYSFDSEKLYPAEFRVTGSSFQVFDTAEARISISPDLDVKLGKKQGSVAGEVILDEALLYSYERRNKIEPSEDVVFVDTPDEEQKDEWPFLVDIKVIAGDKVKVDAYGLKASLGGKLRVMSNPGKPATGEGKLEVEKGYFSVYGRQLEIVTGRLIYSGNPLDNPGISVRAEKTTTEGIITGIEVSGFLQEPSISFYSTPPMAQDEIIRRLLVDTSLVGSAEEEGFMESFASETGLDPVAATVQDVKQALGLDEVKLETGEKSEQLSLVLGTWLTPRLYVSYGKSLIEETGTFNTRYLLGHGFSLVTESSPIQSGVDLKYEFGR